MQMLRRIYTPTRTVSVIELVKFRDLAADLDPYLRPWAKCSRGGLPDGYGSFWPTPRKRAALQLSGPDTGKETARCTVSRGSINTTIFDWSSEALIAENAISKMVKAHGREYGQQLLRVVQVQNMADESVQVMAKMARLQERTYERRRLHAYRYLHGEIFQDLRVSGKVR